MVVNWLFLFGFTTGGLAFARWLLRDDDDPAAIVNLDELWTRTIFAAPPERRPDR